MAPTTATQPNTLPGVPRKPLDAAEQLDALRRAQGKADQRVKLGLQLFKAAQAHTSQRRDLLDKIKAEQAALKDQLQADMAEKLQRYEHRLENFDGKLAESLDAIEQRIKQLEHDWKAAEQRIESTLRRAQAVLGNVPGQTADQTSETTPGIFTDVIRRLHMDQPPGPPSPRPESPTDSPPRRPAA